MRERAAGCLKAGGLVTMTLEEWTLCLCKACGQFVISHEIAMQDLRVRIFRFICMSIEIQTINICGRIDSAINAQWGFCEGGNALEKIIFFINRPRSFTCQDLQV